MARRINTLHARLALSALFIHLVLAPLLYLLVVDIIEGNATELFTNDVRAYSRFLADMLETDAGRLSDEELSEVLDSVVLSHETVYAEVASDQRSVRSDLIEGTGAEYEEDFAFDEHGDDVYYLSMAFDGGQDGPMVLRLGFDEVPTKQALTAARQRIIVGLAIYLGASLILAVLLGLLITRPLRTLQGASQRVASGDYEEHLRVQSGIAEIRELASDLDAMRTNLVKANERLRAEIRERVRAERARSELERTLRHVQKLETIGTLAGGIAHEFNNLLLPIKFYTELAIDDLPEDSPIRKNLHRVGAATARGKSLVQQILAFSRRSHEESFEVVQIGTIVAEVCALADDLFPANVHVRCKLHDESLPVLADVAQIHQMLMNLCSNAYQALSAKGGHVDVTALRVRLGRDTIPMRTELGPGEYVRIDVHDDGHGMDPFTLERVFEPFFSSRAPGEGTGLGLSVAHGIVRAHGGGIAAASVLGEGSVFSVYLPIAASNVSHSGDQGHRPIYVLSDESEDTSRSIAASDEFQAEVTHSLDDLKSVLERAAHDKTSLVIDIGGGDLWKQFGSLDLEKQLVDAKRTLVIVPLASMLNEGRLEWTRLNYLVAPVELSELRAALRRMWASDAVASAGGEV